MPATQHGEVPTGKYVSLKVAADLLHVDVKTIKNWIKAGHLQGFRINNRLWRVQQDELLSLVTPIRTTHAGKQ